MDSREAVRIWEMTCRMGGFPPSLSEYTHFFLCPWQESGTSLFLLLFISFLFKNRMSSKRKVGPNQPHRTHAEAACMKVVVMAGENVVDRPTQSEGPASQGFVALSVQVRSPVVRYL